MNKKIKKFLRRVSLLNVAAGLLVLYLLLVLFPDLVRVFQSPAEAPAVADSVVPKEEPLVVPKEETLVEAVTGNATEQASQEPIAETTIVNGAIKPEAVGLTDIAEEIVETEVVQAMAIDDVRSDLDSNLGEELVPSSAQNIAVGPQDRGSINGVAWLARQAESYYTLQLESFRERISLSDYTSKKPDIDSSKLRQLDSSSGWYYLLYGVYADRDEAMRARAKLAVRDDVMIRNIGTLKRIRCKNLGLEVNSEACWNSD